MTDKFQQQFVMKKTRTDKTSPAPISLSSKRGSLNQEQLFVPYKIDWKSPPLQPVQNTPASSKAFFQNMKAELSTIKNDFEKLIRKEITLKNDRIQQPKASSAAAKNKCMSAYKRDDKRTLQERYPQNERCELVLTHKDKTQDNYNSILNLEKNLPCQIDAKQAYSNAMQKKDSSRNQSIKTITPFDQVDIIESNFACSISKKKSMNIIQDEQKQKDLVNQQMKETMNQLQKDINNYQKDSQIMRTELQKIVNERSILYQKLGQLSTELSHKVQLVQQQQSKIRTLNEDLNRIETHRQQISNNQEQFNNERNFYNERINQLMFHNQNLGNINMQLGGQNQMLKENIFGLQKLLEDMQKRNFDIDNEYKRKMDYVGRDIQQYQKRQDMFSRQIEKLSQQLRAKVSNQNTNMTNQNQNITNQSDYCAGCKGLVLSNQTIELQEQIVQLRDQILHLTRQAEIEKQIHSGLSQKYQEQIANLHIEDISKTFEIKIKAAVDQNIKLKNKLNYCESTLESMTEQNKSYIQQISLYEEREKFINSNKKLNPTQWEEMTETIQKLKQENKKLTEQIQFRNMKKQIEVEQTLFQVSNFGSQNVLKMAHSQLAENQQLKETLKQISAAFKAVEQKSEYLCLDNSKLREQLKIYTNDASQLSKITIKHEQLYSEIQKKGKQFQKAKDILFKIFIEKINKKGDEEDIYYYIREMKQKLASI